MLFYLIYVSRATAPMDENNLLNLLDVSQRWNVNHDLTGMLLYIKAGKTSNYGGRFIQVLEGSEMEVRHIFYDKIKVDSRHEHITLLNEGPLKTRNFQDWSMGFDSISDIEFKCHPGYVELNNGFPESLNPKKFNFALNLLKSFYELRSKIS